MKKTFTYLFLIVTIFGGYSCKETVPVKQDFEIAEYQYGKMIEKFDSYDRMPRSVRPDGSVIANHIHDWTSGFFSGSLWLLYDYTKDQKWETEARKWNAALEPLRHFNSHHDVGFMVYCSFGNGYRLTNDPHYKEIIIDAARALSTRYKSEVGLIQSWDTKHVREGQYPVIIDNMMNLELLFAATKLSGDKTFYDIAVSHADNTLSNHYRDDFSSFHVVDYDSLNGNVRWKRTAQGYADDSAWARGQAWGLYGFTMCYRETKDQRYLNHAIGIADFLLNHSNLPEDYVFYWDFDAPKIPDEPRDVSAACIAASSLLELSKYAKNGKRYYNAAEKILESLSGPEYLAAKDDNGHFIQTKSVGSAPANSEVSVPLNYADYYFLEALLRYDRY